MAEQFIQDVQMLVDVLQQEKEQAKSLSELRANKVKLKASIGSHMKSEHLDEATVPDMAMLSRVSKKRIQGLKRKSVEDWAKKLLGGGEASLQEVGKLYDAREVKVVEDLLVDQL